MRGGKGKRLKWQLQGGKFDGAEVRLSAGVTETLHSPAGFYRWDGVRDSFVMVWESVA